MRTVPELGGRILVITDGDKALADRLATGIGQEFVAMRGRTAPEYLDPATAITAALGSNGRPVVMADPADNAGGGAPSDNTTILRHMIERGVDNAALGPIWDPLAVRLCFDAGLGARFPLRFGGKTGPASGQPIDATVTVAGLARDCWQSFGPTQVPLGDCACVRVGGIEVVLITKRTQALGLELFRNVGRGADGEGDAGGEVHQSLPCGLRTDCRDGAVYRQRRAAAAGVHAAALYARAAANLAAGCGDRAGADLLELRFRDGRPGRRMGETHHLAALAMVGFTHPTGCGDGAGTDLLALLHDPVAQGADAAQLHLDDVARLQP